jgi:hypothetical protein
MRLYGFPLLSVLPRGLHVYLKLQQPLGHFALLALHPL